MIDDSYGNRDGSGRVIRYLVGRLIFNIVVAWGINSLGCGFVVFL